MSGCEATGSVLEAEALAADRRVRRVRLVKRALDPAEEEPESSGTRKRARPATSDASGAPASKRVTRSSSKAQ